MRDDDIAQVKLKRLKSRLTTPHYNIFFGKVSPAAEVRARAWTLKSSKFQPFCPEAGARSIISDLVCAFRKEYI